MLEIREANQQIMTSTGSVGIQRRSYDRVVNLDADVVLPIDVFRNYPRLTRVLTICPAGRVMAKMPMTEESVERILTESPNLSEDIEVISQFVGSDDRFVYLARNGERRDTPARIEDVVDDTSEYTHERTRPIDRIGELQRKGFRFVTNLEDDEIRDQVSTLWIDTFEWKPDEIEALRKRLRENQYHSPNERNMWATFLVDKNNKLITASMAEEKQLNGRLLIESTEWNTEKEYQGKGFGTAAVMATNAQVLSDLYNRDEQLPFLIYAECNYATRADRLGYGAGFEVPSREVLPGRRVPQVLSANVEVNGKLSTFTFMALTESTINTYYSPSDVAAMMKIIDGGVRL